MIKNLNILFKVLILILVNLVVSIWIVFGKEQAPIPMFFAPITYGLSIGILTLNNTKNQLPTSILLGIIFLLVFLVSSFGMLAVSQRIFGTDDLLPILSTPFSVIIIVLTMNRMKEMDKKVLIMAMMIFAGIVATFIGNWCSKSSDYGIWSVFVTIPFLWQTMTGIPLLIGLEKLYTTKPISNSPLRDATSHS